MELNPASKSHSCRKAFLMALAIAAVIFIPVMIWDKGYFFFFGDFNVQQIPFYKLAHEAVRTGDIFWNWYTDLGVNFIGSYSFYLVGSPFFWLTLPFPTEFVPHLMAPLLILKHACAALTACLYLKRFTRNPDYAVFGSLLYAFSGFAVYNIFFNHFHEAIVFFPLMLTGLEELVVNRRRGVFALTVAINAFVNYWFFIGEVVFILLYFAVRSCSPGWQMTVKKFFQVALESVIGLLISMCLFLPAVLAIMGNPRTGTDELLSGWNLWLYWHNQLYPAIVSSAFFPPDLPSRPNLFPDRGAKWASLSAWLPMLGMVGVIAYLKARKAKDWLRRILLASFLFALVPALNSAFILLNNSYYARWYYMPILLMSLATVIALEDRSISLQWSFRFCAIFVAGLTAVLGLTPVISDGEFGLGLPKYPLHFAATAAIALLGLGLCWRGLQKRREGSKIFLKTLSSGLCVIIVVFSLTFIGTGKAYSNDPEFIREVALDGRYQLDLPDNAFARSDIYDGMDNLGMFWHLPNIQAFHSIIPVSIMDFYPTVGVKRDVSSKPEIKYYALRGLLSVRWLFVDENEEDQDLLPGFKLYSNQLGYNIYENQYFIPMGFTYDYYITREELEDIPESQRSMALMRAMVLTDEGRERNHDILEHMPEEYYTDLTQDDYFTDCLNRRAHAASRFEIDNRGFTAQITLGRENLVFFSVPYDKGWKATVNGEPVPVEQASIGFMAVRAPAGGNTIRFTYTPPGLYAGILLSAGGLLLLAIYLLAWKRYAKKYPEPPAGQQPDPVCAADPLPEVLEEDPIDPLPGITDDMPGEAPLFGPEEELPPPVQETDDTPAQDFPVTPPDSPQDGPSETEP